MKWFVLVIFIIMFGGAALLDSSKDLNAESAQKPQVLGASTTRVTDLQLKPINDYRVQNNLGLLQSDQGLKNLTSYRLADMVSNQYYAHQSPDLKTYADLIDDYILGSSVSCENLQLQLSEDIEEAVQAWIDSPEHNSCLLNPNLNRASITVSSFNDASYSSDNNSSNYILVFIASN